MVNFADAANAATQAKASVGSSRLQVHTLRQHLRKRYKPMIADKIFAKIKKCENKDLKIGKILNSPECHTGFKRLN